MAKKAQTIPTVEELILSIEEGFGVKMSKKDKRELAVQIKSYFA